MAHAYTIEFTKRESDAIDWHGYRYSVSVFLQKHIVCDEDNNSFIMELSEPQAWELRDLWEDEGPLSCATGTLNSKIQDFIDKIV